MRRGQRAGGRNRCVECVNVGVWGGRGGGTCCQQLRSLSSHTKCGERKGEVLPLSSRGRKQVEGLEEWALAAPSDLTISSLKLCRPWSDLPHPSTPSLTSPTPQPCL